MGPIPIDNELFIKGIPENATIKINDLNGALLFIKHTTNQTTKIDLSRFDSGAYLIVFETDKGKIVKKIIKN
jgi:hypothetical protein